MASPPGPHPRSPLRIDLAGSGPLAVSVIGYSGVHGRCGLSRVIFTAAHSGLVAQRRLRLLFCGGRGVASAAESVWACRAVGVARLWGFPAVIVVPPHWWAVSSSSCGWSSSGGLLYCRAVLGATPWVKSCPLRHGLVHPAGSYGSGQLRLPTPERCVRSSCAARAGRNCPASGGGSEAHRSGDHS